MLQRSRFIFSLLLIITCGCTPTTNISSDLQEQLCDTTVKDINNSLEMKLSDFLPNTFRQGDPIYVDVRNNSKQEVVYKSEECLQIFMYQENEMYWQSVENMVDYLGDFYFISSPSGPDAFISNPWEFTFYPVVKEKEKVKVRLVVTGYYLISDENTSEAVSAYLDVVLSPK